MEFYLTEAFVIIDLLNQDTSTYIRVTMFEERRIIRNHKSEKIVFIMKAEILKEAVFDQLCTKGGTLCSYGLN